MGGPTGLLFTKWVRRAFLKRVYRPPHLSTTKMWGLHGLIQLTIMQQSIAIESSSSITTLTFTRRLKIVMAQTQSLLNWRSAKYHYLFWSKSHFTLKLANKYWLASKPTMLTDGDLFLRLLQRELKSRNLPCKWKHPLETPKPVSGSLLLTGLVCQFQRAATHLCSPTIWCGMLALMAQAGSTWLGMRRTL